MLSDAPASGWDYTTLAPWYELRAPYATAALDALLDDAGVEGAATVVDIGAGSGRLSLWLHARGHAVEAVEPCAPMRAIGMELTDPTVRWHARDGVDTGLRDACAQLVAYGSSFNVLPAAAAIDEAMRLLGGRGHALVVWNHRDLDDPLQARIEALFRRRIPGYGGGSRRQDPTLDWAAHARVLASHAIVAPLLHSQALSDYVAGFRAHATLIRQLGNGLDGLLDEMYDCLIDDCANGVIRVPFHTRAWCLEVSRACR